MIETIIRRVAERIILEAERLTDLDQAIGDGDHGVNMKRGMEAVLAELPKLAGMLPGDALKAVGMQLVLKVGGASGPLYGTLAIELGKALPAVPTRADLNTAFGLAVAAVAARGKSEVGQKTMLDVLFPVAEALAGGGTATAIKATALAAADATLAMKAIRGRASYLGERSVGHMDPGARSSSLIVATVCESFGA